jgi:hypothetical protein
MKSPPDAILGCQRCHQVHFLGGVVAGETAPRLAGQPASISLIRCRALPMASATTMPCVGLDKGLAAIEREAVARYLSGM